MRGRRWRRAGGGGSPVWRWRRLRGRGIDRQSPRIPVAPWREGRRCSAADPAIMIGGTASSLEGLAGVVKRRQKLLRDTSMADTRHVAPAFNPLSALFPKLTRRSPDAARLPPAPVEPARPPPRRARAPAEGPDDEAAVKTSPLRPALAAAAPPDASRSAKREAARRAAICEVEVCVRACVCRKRETCVEPGAALRCFFSL